MVPMEVSIVDQCHIQFHAALESGRYVKKAFAWHASSIASARNLDALS